jgi:hypothetical protein
VPTKTIHCNWAKAWSRYFSWGARRSYRERNFVLGNSYVAVFLPWPLGSCHSEFQTLCAKTQCLVPTRFTALLTFSLPYFTSIESFEFDRIAQQHGQAGTPVHAFGATTANDIAFPPLSVAEAVPISALSMAELGAEKLHDKMSADSLTNVQTNVYSQWFW